MKHAQTGDSRGPPLSVEEAGTLRKAEVYRKGEYQPEDHERYQRDTKVLGELKKIKSKFAKRRCVEERATGRFDMLDKKIQRAKDRKIQWAKPKELKKRKWPSMVRD